MTTSVGRTPPLPLYELIYTVLRDHLLGGSFPTGLVLTESAVARAFLSSRTPAVTALQRLRNEGFVADLDGAGYLVGADKGTSPIRRDLAELGFRLPPSIAVRLTVRNHHGRIYPDVEHAVAACLSYGRFLLNESALAEHYGVSRTVAHEVLTRLERTGLISQDLNQRWYAGPLTADRLREHFEMRWLLEPAALGQAMDGLGRRYVGERRGHAAKAQRRRLKPATLERLEIELHVEIVLRCANEQLRNAIQRNQLPLIATHSTFAGQRYPDEIKIMLSEHLAIFDHILAGQKKAAMVALEAHIRRSLEPSIERLTKLGSLPEKLQKPFLIQVI